MKGKQHVSIYDESSVEIINNVADTIRNGLLKEVGYMFENIPFSGKAFDMKVEGLKEEFICSISLKRDISTNNERRFYLNLNTIPKPCYANISNELAYGNIEKLYNYLTSGKAIYDCREELRNLMLRADEWRKEQD